MNDEKDKISAIWEIVDRHYGSRRNVLQPTGHPPFDINKENIHDNKSDFLVEVAAVDAALAQASSLAEFLMSSLKRTGRVDVSKRITDHIDDRAREQPFAGDFRLVTHLILKNAMDTGLSASLVYILMEFEAGLKDRKQELENQEAVFWTAKSRSPDHYARSTALRFAQWAARHTGKRPTFGTSRDGSHPSTTFGRALEEIFLVLEITTKPKLPAVWAIKQITDVHTESRPLYAFANIMYDADPAKLDAASATGDGI